MVPLPDGAKMRRTWPQRLLIGLNVLVVLACFSAAAGLGYVRTKVNNLQRISLGAVLSTPDNDADVGEPVNILLVGTDSEEGLDADDPRMQDRDGGQRSDTIMLLRLDPGNATARLLSFPRDLWLTLGDTGTKAKINAALPFGGPDLLINTIQSNFDVPVNHYVQVDFMQFQGLVDAVDGVDIPFDKPVRDEWTGLSIEEPGCVRLKGTQALDYVRSRHLEYYEDGEWYEDPSADLSRIRRQQDFIRRALQRAVVKGARNPFTLDSIVNVALKSVTVDDQLSPQDIIALARKFRSFDPANLELNPMPVYIDSTADGTSIVRPIESELKPILDKFRGLDVPADSPQAVQVTVLNGSGRPSEGSTTAESLRGVGFDVADVGDAPEASYPRSVIQYAPGSKAAATLLSRYLVAGATLQEDATLTGAVPVVFITGNDFAGIRPDPAPATTAAPGATTTTAVAESTTSTTGVGVVPGEGRTDICP